MLRLAKTDLNPDDQQRVVRMLADTRKMTLMTVPELRAIYEELLAMASQFTRLLERVDQDVQH